ncbi:MAG: T9SS type A sorting domain-containing protein [Candidatus Cloacimonetes bacterium]|nr:T9SS type A sorting domain-containing protein [Candidatus Cloacimonadota bacterium]
MRMIFLLLITLFISAVALNATIITVNWDGSGDYATIQEGIDASSNGDTVLVADGIYTGNNNKNLTWNGNEKHIVVKSENGAENCIIDCEDNGRGFNFTNTNQNSNDIIFGFNIKNGWAENGGAIKCINSSPKINNCFFIENTAASWDFAEGGALYFQSSYINVNCCKFILNESSTYWGGAGGAIGCEFSTGLISNCLIAENRGVGSESGPMGGGLYCNYSNLELLNNTFAQNTVSSFFGGFGGGIASINSNIQIRNSILWGNLGGFGMPDQIYFEGGQLLTEYNDIEFGEFSGIGNIDSHPLFVDPLNLDFHLLPSSPCIDAGDPDPLYNDPDGTRNDMGAYYYDQTGGMPYTGPVWYVSTTGSDENDGSADFPFATIQQGILYAAEGDTVLVKEGIYSGEGNRDLDFDGKAIIVTSESGPDSTIIYCEQSGRGFYFHNYESSSSIVNGFTIKKGIANRGGAIYCRWFSSPTISNMILTQNSNTAGYLNGGAGIYCSHYSVPNVINVIIYNNIAAGDGGGIFCDYASPKIVNSFIIGNNATDDGGAIYCNFHSSPKIINCTISGNSASSYGGGIYCQTNSNPTVINCILWNNSPDAIHIQGSNPTVTYSDILGGWTGEGNIDEDPFFADTTNGDYHLTENSPCIDAGNPDTTGLNLPPFDLDGNPRIYNDIIDMGCYEWQGFGIDDLYSPSTSIVLYQNYPNPFSSSTTISFFNTKNTKNTKNIEIKIYNVKGQLVKQLSIFNCKSSIDWDGKDENGKLLSNGIYFYRFTIDDKIIDTKKCVILR